MLLGMNLQNGMYACGSILVRFVTITFRGGGEVCGAEMRDFCCMWRKLLLLKLAVFLYTVNSNKEDETEDDEEQSPVAQMFLGVIYIKPFPLLPSKKEQTCTYLSINQGKK
jgi:hypothetical protein